MKKEYINKRNFKGEVFTKPSKAVPGQSISIQLAVERARQGLPVTGRRIFYDPPGATRPIPRINDLTDLEDLENYVNEVKNRFDDARRNKNKKSSGAEDRSEAE